MKKFSFAAYDAPGKEVLGILDAESQTKAINIISAKGYYPVSVVEIYVDKFVKFMNNLQTDAERKNIIDNVLKQSFCLECGEKITKENPKCYCVRDD